ncbi:hypothetical protein D3C75_956710 [compost metagenome]
MQAVIVGIPLRGHRVHIRFEALHITEEYRNLLRPGMVDEYDASEGKDHHLLVRARVRSENPAENLPLQDQWLLPGVFLGDAAIVGDFVEVNFIGYGKSLKAHGLLRHIRSLSL